MADSTSTDADATASGLAALAIAAAPPSASPPAYVMPPAAFESMSEVFAFLRAHPRQLLVGKYDGSNLHKFAHQPLTLTIESIGPPRLGTKEEEKTTDQHVARQVQLDDWIRQQTAETTTPVSAFAPPASVPAVEGAVGSSSAESNSSPSASPPRSSLRCAVEASWKIAQQEKVSLRGDFFPETGQLVCPYPAADASPSSTLTARVHFFPSATGGRVMLQGDRASASHSQRFECTLALGTAVLAKVQGSPISRQPIQTLALVCRFLSAPDLIATYQSSKQLSAAASHPLTFQNGCQVGLVDELGMVTTYARGPTASFSQAAKLKAAFSGHLFRHFRILRLEPQRSESHSAADFKHMVAALAMETAPSLRSLTLNCRQLSFTWTPEVTRALRFLTHLHLIGTRVPLAKLVATMPPSVELLHLTISGGLGSQVFAESLLKSTCNVTRVVYQSDSPTIETNKQSLVDLQRLQGESRIQKVCWRLPIDLSCDTFDGLSLNLESIRVNHLTAEAIPRLAHFPALTRLEAATIVAKKHRPEGKAKKAKSTAVVEPDHYESVVWPASTRQLTQILVSHKLFTQEPFTPSQPTIDALTQGRFSALEKLHLVLSEEQVTIGAMFATMPGLTDLQLGNISLSARESLDAFKLLPNLRYLRDFHWAYPADADLAPTFPSLTYLHVGRSSHALPLTAFAALSTIPHLQKLKWRRQPVMAPSQIVDKCAQVEEQRLRVQQQQADADAAERANRTRIAQAKGSAAMAAIDAVAPAAGDLASWYRGDVKGVAESAQSIAQRLHAAYGSTADPPTPEQTPKKSPAASTKPFEFTPVAFTPVSDSPFSLTPAQATTADAVSTSSMALAFAGFDTAASFTAAAPFGTVSNPFSFSPAKESPSTAETPFTPPQASQQPMAFFGASSDPSASATSPFASGFKAKPTSAKRTPKR